MNSKGALSPETFENKGKSPDDICVLLLDGDPTCLMIISKMLQKSGYTVLTAGSATDALCIIKDKDGDIDLIMAETHLPDMDKYELLETIGGISDLPVIIMASDQHETTMLGCLFKGASFYLLKPLIMDDLKNLWQFVFKNKQDVLHQLDCDPAEQNGSDEMKQDKKRKGRAETEKNEEYELGDQKKSKLMCTDDLQNTFCQVTGDQYPDGAYAEITPQHMNIPGPTEEDIFAHIQKQQVIETTDRSQTASNFQAGGFLQFPETANLQSQAESSNNAAHIPLQNLYQNVNNSGAEELELNGRETDFSDFLDLGLELLLDWPDLLEEPVPKQEDYQQEKEQLPQEAQASSDIPKKSIEELIDELFDDIW